jgi:hypothetical protein
MAEGSGRFGTGELHDLSIVRGSIKVIKPLGKNAVARIKCPGTGIAGVADVEGNPVILPMSQVRGGDDVVVIATVTVPQLIVGAIDIERAIGPDMRLRIGKEISWDSRISRPERASGKKG